VVLGLAALIVTMLRAFALPSVHGGPHRVPIGVTGPPHATEGLSKGVDGPAWDVRGYPTPAAVRSAVMDRDVIGGLAVTAHGVDVYTATAGAPSATGAFTALADAVAAQDKAPVAVHDLVPFTKDDPHGGGLTAALLPMIFGGIFPALILRGVFPGRRGLWTRLTGGLLFSVVAGAAVAAFLRFGTHSFSGDYGRAALGLILGMAALSTTVLGLEALLGMAGMALGGAVMMLLGNPLSGLATGPHWLPSGWAQAGQLLPPGAAGSLLRANAYFDGADSGRPALVLAVWVAAGLALLLLAGLRREPEVPVPDRAEAVAGSTAEAVTM
jgi:hypothetical protein